MLNTARGTYTITGLMPGLEGQQPQYRIKHFRRLRARRVRERVVGGVKPARGSCASSIYISLLAGFCSGLAAAFDRGFFALLFAAASTFTAYVAFRQRT